MSDPNHEDRGLNILCIEDGGGIRGLSALIILSEIMRRIQRLEKFNAPPLPYIYFDVIAGTGTGALQACMLGKLRMSVDEAIGAYSELVTDVFSDKKWFGSEGSGTFKSTKLREGVMTIVKNKTGNKGERMMNIQAGQHDCKVMVFAMSKYNMNPSTPTIFRSYEAHANPAPDCAIWEAICASMAHPELFKSVRVGEYPLAQSFVDGGMGCNNPLSQVLVEVKTIYPDRHVASIISLGTGRTDTIQIPESRGLHRILPMNVIAAMRQIATDSERVAQEMALRFENTKDVYFRFSVDQGMQQVKLSEWERLAEVVAHTRSYTIQAEVNNKLESAAKALKERQVMLPTIQMDGQIQGKNDEETIKQYAKSNLAPYLANLSPAFSAYYNSAQALELKRGECTPGTRIGVLAHMTHWVSISGPEAGSVYWLNGMAGTGKTTIAYSLCAELASKHQLAASFFCSRLLPDCRDVNRIIPSLSYQLAQYSPPFRAALLKILEKDPDIHTRLPSIQFESLISKPLIEVREFLPTSLAVVIDALDECENRESTRVVINVLLSHALDLPIKFFVSSRPEPEIREEMKQKAGNSNYSQLVLHELDSDTVQADIEKYIRAALAQLELSKAQIMKLVVDAGVLFIYAATAVRYISHRNFSCNPHGRLQTVMNASGAGTKQRTKPIDELYAVVLRSALEDEEMDEAERGDMLLLLHTIVAVQEPLTVNALCGLLKLESEDRVRAAIHPFLSVLHVTSTSDLVTTLHASFPDYLFDKGRSGEYHCDRSIHNSTLARLCFECIDRTTPAFNICGLKSSFILDADVPDLAKKVQEAIPPELLYACRYWAMHVDATDDHEGLEAPMHHFICTRLLLWLEVMNLTRHTQSTVELMWQADEWTTKHTNSPELAELVHDASCFTTSFASHPVSGSTPHIYISMLPFWPSHRPVSRAYRAFFRRLPTAEGTAVNRRQLALLATWPTQRSASGVSFSPDGARVALALGNVVSIVDSRIGRTLVNTLEGHNNQISSIDFSPDGTRIVSGAYDDTIRVWDAETGKPILGPLEGHSSNISSVQYSPNGMYIASGSNDGTIRIWDALSGEMIIEIRPSEEASHGISSAQYSPCGGRIAGAAGTNVYIWDTQTGQILLGILSEHSRTVRSIAYSPDGTRIVSGSFDKTIQVYSALDGSMVLGPLTGHMDAVLSVMYSPDGKHIVSASYGGGVCVWDTETGSIILGPLEESDSASPVCYSRDGTKIISCVRENAVWVWNARSKQSVTSTKGGHRTGITRLACSPNGASILAASDNILYLWDTQTGELILGPLEGHTSDVTSVSYSPAGDSFAASSEDGTVCIWDARTGVMILGPLQAHTNYITSVTYSPDGKSLATGSFDKTICVWDAQTGEMILGPLEGHTDCVQSLRYSPTGTCFVSGSWDGTIRVWDAGSGDLVLGPLLGHVHWVTSIDFSPDGTRIVSSCKNCTFIWDSQTGEVVLRPLDDESWFRGQLRYSPNGDIIYASLYESICLLDAQSGEITELLEGHTWLINWIDLLSGGTHLASCSTDRVIRVWDIRDEVGSECANSSIGSTWKINDDGWVVDSLEQQKLLVWVPLDLRESLMRPRNTLLISRKGFVRLNFENAYLGESWAQCYVPTS